MNKGKSQGPVARLDYIACLPPNEQHGLCSRSSKRAFERANRLGPGQFRFAVGLFEGVSVAWPTEVAPAMIRECFGFAG